MVDRRVALLRGVNVGTAKRVAMADLRAVVESLGYRDVRTLLDSGNVVFTVTRKNAGRVGARIEEALAEQLGVTTRVMVLRGDEVAQVLRENPLRSVADNPSRLLLLVLHDEATRPRLAPLLEQRWSPEALALGERVAYLWCANGILDSRLWAAVERVVGDAGTARNLATLTKLLPLIGAA